MQRQRDGLMGRPRRRVSDGAPPDHRRVRGRAERARAHRYRQGRELGYRRAPGRPARAAPLLGTGRRRGGARHALGGAPLPAPQGPAGRRHRRARARAARSGRRGRPRSASRVLRHGRRGWDVAALQFLLRRRGCDPGGIDGGFGPGTAAAVRRCQRRYGLTADGLAGPRTIRALQRTRGRRRPPAEHRVEPPRQARPSASCARSPHRSPTASAGAATARTTGLDFPAGAGAPVTAGGVGVVRSAGYNAFGYGNLVIVSHRLGFESWYAHLSSVAVVRGQAVSGGVLVGRVGSTGHSSGPTCTSRSAATARRSTRRRCWVTSARQPRVQRGRNGSTTGSPGTPLRRGGGR